MTVAASLYEPYRLNREGEKKSRGPSEEGGAEKGRGAEIKKGDTLQQEMKNKAVTVERNLKKKNRQWKSECDKLWKV